MRQSRRKTEISECDWFDCKGTVNPVGVQVLAWHVLGMRRRAARGRGKVDARRRGKTEIRAR